MKRPLGFAAFEQLSPPAARQGQRPATSPLKPAPTALVDSFPDPGSAAGRAWCDFNGDKHLDLCRTTATAFEGGRAVGRLVVTLSSGDEFERRANGRTLQSDPVDPGYDEGRGWVDFNGDGKADYCRVVGVVGSYGLKCTFSNGTGFDKKELLMTGARFKPGDTVGRDWIDWDGDGLPDYVRALGPKGLAVTFGAKSDFGETVESDSTLDAGAPDSRLWFDVDGDGRPDFIRVVGNNRDLIAVTFSVGRERGLHGKGFGATRIEPLP